MTGWVQCCKRDAITRFDEMVLVIRFEARNTTVLVHLVHLVHLVRLFRNWDIYILRRIWKCVPYAMCLWKGNANKFQEHYQTDVVGEQVFCSNCSNSKARTVRAHCIFVTWPRAWHRLFAWPHDLSLMYISISLNSWQYGAIFLFFVPEQKSEHFLETCPESGWKLRPIFLARLSNMSQELVHKLGQRLQGQQYIHFENIWWTARWLLSVEF